MTRAEIDDALRLREILEVGAARMAANRTLTAAEREVLWSRLTDVRGSAPDDYRRLDSRLHLAIAEAAGSPSLVPLVAENRMRLNGLLDQIPLLSRNIAHSDEQHEAIVIAILAGDGERRGGSDAGPCRRIGRASARLSGLAAHLRPSVRRPTTPSRRAPGPGGSVSTDWKTKRRMTCCCTGRCRHGRGRGLPCPAR